MNMFILVWFCIVIWFIIVGAVVSAALWRSDQIKSKRREYMEPHPFKKSLPEEEWLYQHPSQKLDMDAVQDLRDRAFRKK